MPGLILVSGLGVSTVGLVACATFLGLEAAHGLPTAAAIALLGAGAVLALIGVQLFLRAPSAYVSATQLLASSVTRSVLVMALIGAGIALSFGHHFAFDHARVVGQAFPAVVVVDLIVYLSALQARVWRPRQRS